MGKPGTYTINGNNITTRTSGYTFVMTASFNGKSLRSRRYRNRRLGEFLKELDLTEGRATGIPTVQVWREQDSL
jgi:hypothetical protein